MKFIFALIILLCSSVFIPFAGHASPELYEDEFTKAELDEIKKSITWGPLEYDETLEFMNIEDFENESILGGRYNTSGYVLTQSECLSPCAKDEICIALCVQGIIIASEPTVRKPHFTGHDVVEGEEMVILFYPRGREETPDIFDLEVGGHYMFSIEKNPYQSEIIGYKKVE